MLFRAVDRRLLPLAAIVGANLGAGVGAMLSQPSARLQDLHIITAWTRAWRIGAEPLYAQGQSAVDYPPHAIVFFSPLGLIPPAWLDTLWVTLTVLMWPVLAYVVV